MWFVSFPCRVRVATRSSQTSMPRSDFAKRAAGLASGGLPLAPRDSVARMSGIHRMRLLWFAQRAPEAHIAASPYDPSGGATATTFAFLVDAMPDF
jgi:hypothetical protein